MPLDGLGLGVLSRLISHSFCTLVRFGWLGHQILWSHIPDTAIVSDTSNTPQNIQVLLEAGLLGPLGFEA